MAIHILKMTDGEQVFYLEWSTNINAPTTFGMSLDEFKEFYREEYGNKGMQELPERLERVEKTGCSAYGKTLSDVLVNNHAGDHEKKISKKEIIRKYCLERPKE